MKGFRAFSVAAIVALAAGCSSSINTPPPLPTPSGKPPPSNSIQHVVILLQENRSFNNIFMGFPGAETATEGNCIPYQPPSGKEICSDPSQPVKLHPVSLQTCRIAGCFDLAHSHADFEAEVDENPATHVLRMDGFDTIRLGTTGSGPPALFIPYAYIPREEVQPYWDMASQYTLADHMFSTATTDSFVAHQEVISGTTALNSNESITNVPSNMPWGCDGVQGETTDLILKTGVVEPGKGPFPCFTQWKTMADVLDAAGVSWRYYVESWNQYSPYGEFSGRVWDAFDAIKSVRYGPDWKNVVNPNTAIFKDLQNHALPSVSWLIPTLPDSDHPASGCDKGPHWVTTVVNAIGKSPYWKNTAIIILWDDWGGWYDPVPPPQLDYTSLGMRVPMIVISPFAKRHFVSKTQYEFGSVLKFIEQNFGAGSLGSTDVRANSIGDVFDFKQQISPFKPITLPIPGPCHQLPADSVIIRNDGGVPD